MKVSKLKKNPGNPRQIKGEKLDKLKASVAGFQKMTQTAYRDTLNKHGAEEYFRFTREPAFVPKDAYLELQVADKLVYEATKRASHHLDFNPPGIRATLSPESVF